jgi:hypothetical protein
MPPLGESLGYKGQQDCDDFGPTVPRAKEIHPLFLA